MSLGMTFTDIAPALPEIFLALSIIGLLLFGTVRGDRAMRAESITSCFALLAALVMIWFNPVEGEAQIIFGGLFIVDTFAQFMKSVLIIGAILAITMGETYAEREGLHRFEYPIIIMIATLGTLLMVSANDMMSLYVGLELQSLALYILAAFKRDERRSSEAGLKYFVLGGLSSGIILYGMSLIYGTAGTTNFNQLAEVVSAASPNPLLIIGLVFMLCGLAFKISAVPFHMWTPDVYEGAPTAVTAFFASVPKVAGLALLLRVLAQPFETMHGQWQMIVILMAVASMLIGAFAALRQTNIKRLMAYSSIGHVGYALVGLAAGGLEGFRGVLIYLVIYFMMTLGVFAVILTLRRGGKMVEAIDDLSGLGKQHPAVALCMVIIMFSMAGVPPLAGFFGKFYVFMAAVDAGLYALAIVGVLLSTVSAYYYLRIIKVMYFDEPSPLGAIDPVPELSIRVVLGITTVYLVVFAFVPGPVLAFAGKAAQSLLG